MDSSKRFSPELKKNPTPAVLWFTGLSGAGKSTVACAVNAALGMRGVRTEFLDGDAVRAFAPTGFSRSERDGHVRRVGFLASRLEHHDVTVVCALISPYEEARRYVRGLCRRFIEVYVSTPLTECERRDVKGLYARARRGEIVNFTGIDDPYEPPHEPELVLDTTTITVDEAAARVLAMWERVTADQYGWTPVFESDSSNRSTERQTIDCVTRDFSSFVTRESSEVAPGASSTGAVYVLDRPANRQSP
jgi:adenylyl-sulfate kinase